MLWSVLVGLCNCGHAWRLGRRSGRVPSVGGPSSTGRAQDDVIGRCVRSIGLASARSSSSPTPTQGGSSMRLSYRAVIALGAIVLAAAAPLGGQARSTAGGGWTRISGPTQPGAQLGLARTKDGVLHVIWN